VGYPLARGIYGPVTRFSIVGVQPPATGYLGPSDQLSVSVLSPNATARFSLSLRYLDLQGNVQPLLVEIATPATGVTPAVTAIQLAEGFLLSAVAYNGNLQRGQCWVQFVVLRQKADATIVVADVLLQGYVSATDYVAWPGTPQLSSLDGRGALLTYPGAGGGVDTAVTITVPPGVRWHVRGCSCDIAGLAAAAQTEALLLAMDAAGNVISGSTGLMGIILPALAATAIVFGRGATPFFSAGATVAGSLPELLLRAGDVLSLILDVSPGGVTYSNFQVNVEEYVEI
jgi:hypothetical protein